MPLTEEEKERIREHMGYPGTSTASTLALGLPQNLDFNHLIEAQMTRLREQAMSTARAAAASPRAAAETRAVLRTLHWGVGWLEAHGLEDADQLLDLQRVNQQADGFSTVDIVAIGRKAAAELAPLAVAAGYEISFDSAAPRILVRGDAGALERALTNASLAITDRTGVIYNPLADRWQRSKDMDVNYMVVAEEM